MINDRTELGRKLNMKLAPKWPHPQDINVQGL